MSISFSSGAQAFAYVITTARGWCDGTGGAHSGVAVVPFRVHSGDCTVLRCTNELHLHTAYARKVIDRPCKIRTCVRI